MAGGDWLAMAARPATGQAGRGAESDAGPAEEAGATSEMFAANARRLCGLAARLAGWRPDEFWHATPMELGDVLTGWTGDATGDAVAPPTTALIRAVRTGKFGFEDLKRVALSALADIAANAIRGGIGSLFGSGGGGSGGGSGGIGGLIIGLGQAFASAMSGSPGRATGGPVSAGRAYRVGENGPEWFVPPGDGRIVANGGGGGRDVRIAITVNGPAGASPAMLAQSSKQVARAVRRALSEE